MYAQQFAGLESYYQMPQNTIHEIRECVTRVYAERNASASPSIVAGVVGACASLHVTLPEAVKRVAQALASTELTLREKGSMLIEAVILQNNSNELHNLPTNAFDIKRLANLAVNYVNENHWLSFHHIWEAIYCAKGVQSPSEPANEALGPDQTSPTKPKVEMLVLEENFYRSIRADDEVVVSREYGIHPKSEMPMQGVWVMRNYHTGEFIDSDRNRTNLFERNYLRLPS